MDLHSKLKYFEYLDPLKFSCTVHCISILAYPFGCISTDTQEFDLPEKKIKAADEIIAKQHHVH
jgi:hypothetical protein